MPSEEILPRELGTAFLEPPINKSYRKHETATNIAMVLSLAEVWRELSSGC